jgi:glycosyltransferase involved in cell wall biosynthesis
VMFPHAAFAVRPFPERERPARVFYGGVLRGRYPVEVARALGPAIEQHPQAEFVVIGDREVFDALPTTAKRYYDYMPFEAYLHLMSECAISLSPIEALPMRDTKSDAKFLDASRAGVLTIASPTIYERTIEHGVNGLLAPQVEHWAPLLARALSDEPWRQGMARRAWAQVRDTRMFADQVAAREDWYRDLWSRRAELNEALMGRMPGLREAVNA